MIRSFAKKHANRMSDPVFGVCARDFSRNMISQCGKRSFLQLGSSFRRLHSFVSGKIILYERRTSIIWGDDDKVLNDFPQKHVGFPRLNVRELQ